MHTPSIPISNASIGEFIARHNEWSYLTFGSPADGRGPAGPLDHVKKEIEESKKDPADIMEWVDIIFLSIDGALRSGQSQLDLGQVFNEALIRMVENQYLDEWMVYEDMQAIVKRLESDPTFVVSDWNLLLTAAIYGYRFATGGHMSELLVYMFAKQRKNFNRDWPDWRTIGAGKAVEHVRGIHD